MPYHHVERHDTSFNTLTRRMSPSTPYADVLGIRLLAALAPGNRLWFRSPANFFPLIYTMYMILSFPNPFPRYSTASPSDSRTLTVAVKNNGIPSVAVEYMDQIPQLQQYHDEQGSPARVFSATQVL